MQREAASRKRARGHAAAEAGVDAAEPPAQRRRGAGLVLAESRVRLDAVAPAGLEKDWMSGFRISDGGLRLEARVEKRDGTVGLVAVFGEQEVARAPLRQLLGGYLSSERDLRGLVQGLRLGQGVGRALVTVAALLKVDPSPPAPAPEERFPGVALVVKWAASEELLEKASVAARSGPRPLGAPLRAFRRLLACLYPNDLPELVPAAHDATPSVTPAALLAEAGPRDFPCAVRFDRLAADFTLTLMKYQRECVAWMLLREGVSEEDEALEWAGAPLWRAAAVRQHARPLPPQGRGPLPFAPLNVDRSPLVWRPLGLPGGRRLWVCPLTGGALLDGTGAATVRDLTAGSRSPVTGGILADDTGLGKTVQVESCVLLHRWRRSAEEEGELARLRAGSLPAAVPPHSPLAQRLQGAGAGAGPGGRAVQAFRCICQPRQWPTAASAKPGAATFSCSHCSLQQHVECAGADVGGGVGGLAPLCSECLSLLDSIPSGATLVVCTPAILEQWTSELVHHIRPGALRITVRAAPHAPPHTHARLYGYPGCPPSPLLPLPPQVYAGVRSLSKRARWWAGRGKQRASTTTTGAPGGLGGNTEQDDNNDDKGKALDRIEALLDSAEAVGTRGLDPRRLAESDIVLTTYATLSRDLKFVGELAAAVDGADRGGGRATQWRGAACIPSRGRGHSNPRTPPHAVPHSPSRPHVD